MHNSKTKPVTVLVAKVTSATTHEQATELVKRVATAVRTLLSRGIGAGLVRMTSTDICVRVRRPNVARARSILRTDGFYR